MHFPWHSALAAQSNQVIAVVQAVLSWAEFHSKPEAQHALLTVIKISSFFEMIVHMIHHSIL
jgi:hypothetical protein